MQNKHDQFHLGSLDEFYYTPLKGVRTCSCVSVISSQEQDKSTDIEQHPPFGDRMKSNTLPQTGGGGYKTNGNII